MHTHDALESKTFCCRTLHNHSFDCFWQHTARASLSAPILPCCTTLRSRTWQHSLIKLGTTFSRWAAVISWEVTLLQQHVERKFGKSWNEFWELLVCQRHSPMWIWVWFIEEMKNCLSTSYLGFLYFGKFCESCISWTFTSNSLVWINAQTGTLLKKIWQFVPNAFGHAFLHLPIFLLSWYCIWTLVLLPTIGESGSLSSRPLWTWCLAGRGQSQRFSSIGSTVLKNFRKVWHWNWNMKQLIFICKHFTTTLAVLVSSHIVFCLLYDLVCVFSYFF